MRWANCPLNIGINGRTDEPSGFVRVDLVLQERVTPRSGVRRLRNRVLRGGQWASFRWNLMV